MITFSKKVVDNQDERVIIEFKIPEQGDLTLEELRLYFYRFCAALGYDVYIREEGDNE